MANLLSTCTSESGNIQHISPQNAGWEYVGFDVWQLKAGESITLPSDERERCLVLVAGLASVKAADSFFYRIGQRMSPFERIPAYSVYLPHHTEAKVTAETDLELAVCSAPGFGELPVRLISPQEVGVEHRVVRDEPDGLAHALGFLLHVDTRQRHRSVRGARQRGEHAQKRGLARAVGAEDRQERALRQRERHVVDGLAAAERLRQVIDGKRRFHGTTPPPSHRR